MKKLFIAILSAVAVFAAVPQAEAQVYGTTTLLDGGTNNVATTATNAYTKLIVAEKRAEVGLLLSFKGTGADTGVVTLVLQRSLDNSTWSTTTQRYAVTANGTSTVTFVTNVTAGAVGYLRVAAIENACTNAITNVVVKYSLKP